MVRPRYGMPPGMRPATLAERQAFYGEEFDPGRVGAWLEGRPTTIFAVKLGKVTGIFKAEFKGDEADTILLTQTPQSKLREALLHYLPEGAYYDRNLYRDPNAEDMLSPDNVLGQELAFDLDPENVPCPNCGTLEERLDRGEMYTFCTVCFSKVQAMAVALVDFLASEFQRVQVVYSGRGWHVHVRDRRATLMGTDERRELSASVAARGIEHDEWVTQGSSRLIRMPHGLHGLVSRIVLPVARAHVADFDPVVEARPAFL